MPVKSYAEVRNSCETFAEQVFISEIDKKDAEFGVTTSPELSQLIFKWCTKLRYNYFEFWEDAEVFGDLDDFKDFCVQHVGTAEAKLLSWGASTTEWWKY